MLAQALATLLPSSYRSERPGPADDFWYGSPGRKTASGVIVRPDGAMKVGAVFACIRILRESLGSLPYRVYQRVDERTSKRRTDHWLYSTLHDKPNRWQTPIEWKEMAVNHLCLRGNFYCEKYNNEYGETELIPLAPDRMSVTQLSNNSLQYNYRPQSGGQKTYRQGQIHHIRGLSLNGITGVSVLEFAANTVGLSIAQQTHGASLFRNGGLPAFWVKRPKESGRWTTEAKKNFRDNWRAIHGGPENAGNPPLLQDGMELHELGLTNRDSQWLESLDANAVDICRFFGVLPHMIGVRNVEAKANVEQAALEFVMYTLGPLAVRFEQSADRDLVDEDGLYCKIALDALMRGDMLSRYQAHNIAIQGGWELVNEARELEDRNPIEGGDVPRFPANMQPAGGAADWNEQGGQPGKGQPKPKEKPPVEPDVDDEPTAREKRRADRRKKQRAKTEAAFSLLLEDAAGRIAAAEIKGLSARASKAESDRERWNLWYRDDFAPAHEGYIRKTLTPIAAAWSTQGGHGVNLDALLDWLAADAARELEAGAVPEVLAAWKTDKAACVLAALKQSFGLETDHA